MKQHSEQQQKALKASAESLYKAFLTLETAGEVRQFLLDLCTPSELEAIVDRWWTASLLKEGHSYREISTITGVSVTTIGRVARYLNMGEGGYRLAMRREKAGTQEKDRSQAKWHSSTRGIGQHPCAPPGKGPCSI